MISPQMLAGIGIMLLLAISHGYAFVKGRGWERGEWQAKVAEQTEKARETERMWQGAYNEASKQYLAKIRTTDDRLRIALDGLRDRPDRPVGVPETPRANCEGANGAELGKQHAEFLIRLASSAAKQDAALVACYAAIDTLQQVGK